MRQPLSSGALPLWPSTSRTQTGQSVSSRGSPRSQLQGETAGDAVPFGRAVRTAGRAARAALGEVLAEEVLEIAAAACRGLLELFEMRWLKARGQADNRHSGGVRRGDAHGRVFEDQAIAGRNVETPGRFQKHVGCGFAARYLIASHDHWKGIGKTELTQGMKDIGLRRRRRQRHGDTRLTQPIDQIMQAL